MGQRRFLVLCDWIAQGFDLLDLLSYEIEQSNVFVPTLLEYAMGFCGMEMEQKIPEEASQAYFETLLDQMFVLLGQTFAEELHKAEQDPRLLEGCEQNFIEAVRSFFLAEKQREYAEAGQVLMELYNMLDKGKAFLNFSSEQMEELAEVLFESDEEEVGDDETEQCFPSLPFLSGQVPQLFSFVLCNGKPEQTSYTLFAPVDPNGKLPSA